MGGFEFYRVELLMLRHIAALYYFNFYFPVGLVGGGAYAEEGGAVVQVVIYVPHKIGYGYGGFGGVQLYLYVAEGGFNDAVYGRLGIAAGAGGYQEEQENFFHALVD